MTHIFGACNSYERIGIVPLDKVNSVLDSEIFHLGYRIHTGSARYKLFADNPCCVRCGTKGLYYGVERSIKRHKGSLAWHPTSKGFHLNLYGKRDNGREVMMTKDHIVPKSKGGPDHLSNYQTMCAPCNSKKGDKVD